MNSGLHVFGEQNRWEERQGYWEDLHAKATRFSTIELKKRIGEYEARREKRGKMRGLKRLLCVIFRDETPIFGLLYNPADTYKAARDVLEERKRAEL